MIACTHVPTQYTQEHSAPQFLPSPCLPCPTTYSFWGLLGLGQGAHFLHSLVVYCTLVPSTSALAPTVCLSGCRSLELSAREPGASGRAGSGYTSPLGTSESWVKGSPELTVLRLAKPSSQEASLAQEEVGYKGRACRRANKRKIDRRGLGLWVIGRALS